VAVEVDTGRERVFRRGSLPEAVFASAAFPGLVRPRTYQGLRHADACVKHTVPAALLADEGADFVIACHPVPAPHRRRQGTPSAWAKLSALSGLDRLGDGAAAILMMLHDAGRTQSQHADAVFSPDLSPFSPVAAAEVPAIIAAAEAELDPWLVETADRYDAFRKS
jgi:NTE family protein